MSTLNYKFGGRRPSLNADLVEEQMRLTHTYYNKLTELRRKKRDKIRAIIQNRDLSQIDPVVKEYESSKFSLDAAVAELKEARARTRSRSDTSDQRAHIAALREHTQELYKTLKAERSKIKMSATEEAAIKEAKEELKREIRDARNASGVFWGTYLQTEAASEASESDMPYWCLNQKTQKMEPNDPEFKRWQGEGFVSVQIQKTKPLSAEALLQCKDTRAQLELLPLPEGPHSKTQLRKRYGVLRLRVGSDGRKPIWAEWPIVIHRPFPQGASIKWVKAKRTKVADHARWDFCFTLECSGESRHNCCGDGLVAINFGWRKKSDGSLRVAYCKDIDGVDSEFCLNPEVISGFRKSDSLRSIRDRSALEFRDCFYAKFPSSSVQSWILERLGVLDKKNSDGEVKSAARLRGLWKFWTLNHFENDELQYGMLDAWYKNDLHLWRWEAHQRKKSERRRLDSYRIFAAKLSGRYKVLVIDDFDMRETQKHKVPESEDVEIKAARLQQRDAACSELRLALTQAFLSRGGRVVKVKAHLNTQRCETCECETRWDAKPRVEHTCVQCGNTWDQDENNTRNILRRFHEDCEQEGGVEELGAKRQAKWGKLGRHVRGARKKEDNSTELLVD